VLVKVYKCDQCGVEEKEPNGWFVVSKISSENKFVIEPWFEDEIYYHHELCGLPCVFKKISELNTAI
jgi:hypothetical protein